MKQEKYQFETVTEPKRKVMETFINKEGVRGMISPQAIIVKKENEFVGLFEFIPFLDHSEEIVFHLIDHDDAREITEVIVNTFGEKDPNVKQFMINVKYGNAYGMKFAKNIGWTETHEYDELMMAEGSEFFSLYKKANPYYEPLERKLK